MKPSLKKIVMLLAVTGGVVLSAIFPMAINAEDADAWALSFDSQTDYVELTYTSDMFPAGWQTTKTVSLWVKPEGLSRNCVGIGLCDVIFGDRPLWWGIQRGVLDGLDRIWVWNWGFISGNDCSGNIIGIPYSTGEWVHITLVHQAGILTAYKNGLVAGTVASGATCQPLNPAQKPWLHIGGVIKDASNILTFRGMIDEVRLYSIALTQQQIIDTIVTELTPPVTGLVAYYKMSDGEGTTLTDDSGNGWHGTLRDGTGSVPGNGTFAQWVSSNLADYLTEPVITPTATIISTIIPSITPSPTVMPTQPDPSGEDYSVFLPLVKK
jgi:hypothetical protein